MDRTPRLERGTLNKDSKEIEIKVRIEHPEVLEAFLKKNAKPAGDYRQIDEYFTPAHRDFLAREPIKEWLRLRSEPGRYTVNYKNFYYNKEGKTTEADEFETQVSDVDIMRRIFRALDLKPIVIVDKTRHSWLYGDYEISIDHVSGIGTFIEIESKRTGKDSKKITAGMMAFLRGMKVGKIERDYQGYAFLKLFPERSKFSKN